MMVRDPACLMELDPHDMDRFHLVMDVIDRVSPPGSNALVLKQKMRDKLIEHKSYIMTYGQDLPEIRDWTWES